MRQIEEYAAYYESSDSASLAYTLKTHNYIRSGRLKKIDLHNCTEVNTVEANPNSLVWNPRKHNIQLDVSGCSYLTKLKIAGNQAKVNISYCNSLPMADLISVKPLEIYADHCSNLYILYTSILKNTQLDLTSDSSLWIVNFSSAPYLTSVDFTECKNLEYFCTKVFYDFDHYVYRTFQWEQVPSLKVLNFTGVSEVTNKMLPCKTQYTNKDQPFQVFHPVLQSIDFTGVPTISVEGEFSSLNTVILPERSAIHLKLTGTDISESSVLQHCYTNRDSLNGYVSFPLCNKPITQPQQISKAQKIIQDTSGRFIYDYPVVFKSSTAAFIEVKDKPGQKYPYKYNQSQDTYQVQFRRGIERDEAFPAYITLASDAVSLYCQCSPVYGLNIHSEGLPLLAYQSGGFWKSLPETIGVTVSSNKIIWQPNNWPQPNPYAADSVFNPCAGKLKKLVLKRSKLASLHVCCDQDFSCSLQQLPRLCDVELTWPWIRSSQRALVLADQLLKAVEDSQSSSDQVQLKRSLHVYPVKPSAFAQAKESLQDKGWEVSYNQMFTIQTSDSFVYMTKERAFKTTAYDGIYCPPQASALLPPSYGPKGASIYSPGKQGVYNGVGQVVYKGTTQFYPAKLTSLHIGQYQQNYQSNRLPIVDLDVSNTSIQRLLIYPLYVARGSEAYKFISLSSLNVSNCKKLDDFAFDIMKAPNWTSAQILKTMNQLYANGVTEGRLILGQDLYDRINLDCLKRIYMIGQDTSNSMLQIDSEQHLNWNVQLYVSSSYMQHIAWKLIRRLPDFQLPDAQYHSFFHTDDTSLYQVQLDRTIQIYDWVNAQGKQTPGANPLLWLDGASKIKPLKVVSTQKHKVRDTGQVTTWIVKWQYNPQTQQYQRLQKYIYPNYSTDWESYGQQAYPDHVLSLGLNKTSSWTYPVQFNKGAFNPGNMEAICTDLYWGGNWKYKQAQNISMDQDGYCVYPGSCFNWQYERSDSIMYPGQSGFQWGKEIERISFTLNSTLKVKWGF